MTQHEAFLAQARSDHAMFDLLLKQPRDAVPACHPLHYLQMASEKLAKALLIKSGGLPVPRSHVAFSKLARELAARHDMLRALGYKEPEKTARFLRRVVHLFRQVEELCPSVAGQRAEDGGLSWDQGQNVEYPWRPTGDDWVAPADQSFGALQMVTEPWGDGASMLGLVRRLLDSFENVP